MLWWSLFTALTPTPRQLAPLVAIRILMGLGESGVMPAMSGALVRWFPRQEYSRATGFCWSGGYAGSIVGFPIASAILSVWGWPSIFAIFAIVGLAWLPFWWWLVRDRPEESRGVSKEELAVIAGGRPPIQKAEAAPWGKLLRMRPLWAAWILHFSSNWFSYVMITWLPTYLSMERKFSLASMAFGAALPFLCALIGSNVFGAAIDRMSRNGDRTRVRKLFMAPYALSALTVLAVPLAPTGPAVVVVLCIAMFLLTSATPVYASSALDIVPRYAGTVVGVQNALANLAGVLAPVVIGYVVKAAGWSPAFWLTAAISVIGIGAYLLWGRCELAD
jgi:ACS family sodium-dependent inorganic phosphate cotransporter-like MFS transporter 5